MRFAKGLAIGVALAVPLGGIGSATVATQEAAAASPQAQMSGRGEATAPVQQLGSGKLDEAAPPVGKNTVVPPSLRQMFPTDLNKPPAPTKQVPLEVQPSPAPKQPENSFNEKTSQELVERRDRFTQTFENTDKSETTVFSQAPMNFKKPDGSWAEIDAGLKPSDKGGWEVISNDIYTWIAPRADSAPLAQIELGSGHTIGWSVSGAAGSTGQMAGNKVLFPAFALDADLELESQPTGIKETIVLNTKTAGRTYTFPLQLSENLTPSLVGGQIILKDENGTERGKIPAGTMEDSNTIDGRATSTAIKYELVTADGKPALKVIVDDAWLDDPARVYPVRVDPTFYSTESQTPIYALSAGRNGSVGGASELQIGCRPVAGSTSCTGTGAWNAFGTFLSFPNLAPALRYHQIFTARLDLLNYQTDTCGSRAVDVYNPIEEWRQTPLPELKYPGPAMAGSPIASASFSKGYVSPSTGTTACRPGYASLNFNTAGRDLVQGIVDGTRPDFGFGIMARERADKFAWKKFAGINSANPPRLVVTHSPYRATYQLKPQAPADYVTQDKDGKFPMTITNLGAETWQPTTDYMTYRVYNAQRQQVSLTELGTNIPSAVPRGGKVTMPVNVQKLAGSPAGTVYYIQFSMVHRISSIHQSFADWGVPPAEVKITVKNVPPVLNPAKVRPLNGAQAAVLTPQFWADAVDPDAPETTLQYSFKVCEVVGSNHEVGCFNSAYSASKTWVAPAGKLGWNREYEWRSYLKDNDGAITISAPITLFTDVPQPLITSHIANSEAQSKDKPYDPQVGNYTTAALDIVVPVAGPELNVARTYNSLDPRRTGAFGAGWSSRYDMQVSVENDGNLLITYPDGRQVRFAKNADGTYAPPRGSKAIITATSATGPWTLQIAPGTKYEFAAGTGKLAKIYGAQGKPLALTYRADGTLDTAASQDGAGRKLKFAWTADKKHVASVSTDPVGGTPLTWTYEYAGDVLTKSCNSEQECTTYGSQQGSHYRSAVLDSKPDAYYRMSDDAGDTEATNEVDITLQNEFGTYAGTEAGQDSPLSGVGDGDKSIRLNGASSVSLKNGLLSRSRNSAIEMWFKTDKAVGQPLIGYQTKGLVSGSTAGMPLLYVGSDGKLRGQFWHGTAAPITSTVAVNNNQWHHVVLTATETKQSIYLDGALVGNITGGTISNEPFPVNQIGAAWAAAPGAWPGWGTGATKYFDGQIDEVALYSHPLSDKEVVGHYEQGRTTADQLTSVTSAGGKTVAQVSYDPAMDRLLEYVDANGGSWKLGKPAVTGDDNELVRTVRVQDPANRSYVYEYDALGGWLLRSGRPLGTGTRKEDHPGTPAPEVAIDWPGSGYGIRSFTHDKTGQLTKVTSEVGGEVSMTYDTRGNVASTKTCRTGATDCRTEYSTYHANATWPALDPRWDKLAIFRDGRSANATDDTYKRGMTLTVAGDVAAETTVDGGLATYAYTDGVATGPDGKPMPPGLLKTTTKKVNSTVTATTQYLYNEHGQLVQLTALSGLVTKYTYDEIGRKRTETQVSDSYPSGATTTYDYDKMSRITGITGPVTTDAVTGEQHQQKAELEFDDDGNVTKSTAKDLKTSDEPRTTTFGYDDRNRLIRTVDAAGNESQQGYDQFGNRTWSQDAKDTRWEYAYNDLNMLTEVRDVNLPGDPASDPETDPEDLPTEGVDYTVKQTTQYDPAGRKAVEMDAMKRVTNYAYNSDDSLKTTKLIGFHNPDGSTRDYVLEDNTYDNAGNRLKAVTDNGKTTTEYTYDAVGRVQTTTTDPQTLKRKTTATVDLAGNVTKQETTGVWSNADIAGPVAATDVTNYIYDAAGRRLEQSVQNTDGSFLKTSWTYDQRGLSTSMTQPRGNLAGAVKADFTTTYGYDELGRQIRTVAPQVQAEQAGGAAAAVNPTSVVGYGAFGQTTSSKDALGNIVKTAFDKLGRPVEWTAPQYTPPGGQAVTPKSQFEYDAVGNVLAQIDERGNATRFTYDHLNQQVQIDAPSKTNDERALTKITYNPNGDIETSTDPLGAVKKFTYDDLDRVVTSTDVERKPVAGNFVTKLTYDDMDNVVKAETPSGAAATSTYDSLGQLTQSQDPNGVITKLGYDYAGRQVRSTDGMGRSSVATYDRVGQMVASKTLDAANASLGTTQLAYDADGNLTSSTPASGKRATVYTYDALGRLTKQVDPVTATDSITIGYGYDAAGNRTRYTDGRGNSTIYTLNSLGLPEKVIESSTTTHPSAADRTWTASYDAAGNPVNLLSPGGLQRTRTFDAAGRLVKEEGAGAEVSTSTRDLTYDLAGRLATSNSLDGANTYFYNDRSMLLRADGPSGTSTQGYDADGQLTQRIDAAGTADFTYTNGRPTTVTDPVTRTIQTLGYNTAGQLSTIDYGLSRVRTVGYDAYGRMNSDTLKAGTASVSSMTYGYDADNNVTSKKTTGVAGAGDNTYAYDQLGRLTSWKVGTKTTDYGWDEASNRTKNGTKLATYDERNRLINDGSSTYTYSARGALLSKTDGTTTEAFTFDAFDRMIRNSDRDFTYDALDRPVQAGTARMRYDGFSDEVVTDGTQSFGRSASDGLLSMGYDTTKRLVMADRHGDIIAGFDPTDGALSTGLPDTRTYDPFGNSTNASGLKYRVGYQGDWTDPRSGDVNQGARWYNPGSATFNSRDTQTYEGGVASSLPNLYAYATGNPLTFNDPDGHRAVDPEGSELNRKCNERFVGWNGDSRVWKRICYETPKPTPPPPPPPPDCEKTKTCDGGIGDGGCKKNCKTSCEKRGTCKPTCKSSRCNPEPPPPPKCDRACELRKETIDTREKLDHDAQEIAVPPPGAPSCSNGNPSLCPTNPGGPSIVVGDYEDHSDDNGGYAEQLYKDAVDNLGSVIGSVAAAGSLNFSMFPTNNIEKGGGPAGGAVGGPGGSIGGGTGGGGVGGRVGGGGGRSSVGTQSCGCTPQIGPNGQPIHDIPVGSAGGYGAGKRIPQQLLSQFGIGKNAPPGSKTPLCSYCRLNDATGLDHVVPRIKLGDLTNKNLAPACTFCNSSKGARVGPANPPPNYFGAWPPPWWPNSVVPPAAVERFVGK